MIWNCLGSLDSDERLFCKWTETNWKTGTRTFKSARGALLTSRFRVHGSAESMPAAMNSSSNGLSWTASSSPLFCFVWFCFVFVLLVKSKETVGNSVLERFKSYFGSQIASQSLNEVHIYRLQPKSATKGDFFSFFFFQYIFLWLFRVGACCHLTFDLVFQ